MSAKGIFLSFQLLEISLTNWRRDIFSSMFLLESEDVIESGRFSEVSIDRFNLWSPVDVEWRISLAVFLEVNTMIGGIHLLFSNCSYLELDILEFSVEFFSLISLKIVSLK